jgi:hypothetical protein
MNKEDIINLIATDGSAAEISDGIKSFLFAKSAEKIDAALPLVASNMFDSEDATSDWGDE